MPSSSHVAHGVSKTIPVPIPEGSHHLLTADVVAAGLVVVFICSRLHHEKWQLIGFTVIQTALIGSMASVGAEDEAQAIVTVVLAATTITPPQLLSFTMLSFGLDDQADLYVTSLASCHGQKLT